MKIEWNENLSTGVPKIDAQHKGLINLINSLEEAVESRTVDAHHLHDKTYKATIIGLVMKLRDYAFYHFYTEEIFMRSIRYSGYIRHRREHDIFSLRLLKYEINVLEGDYMQAEDLLGFVMSWFSNHVRITDMAYVPHASTSGGEGSAQKETEAG